MLEPFAGTPLYSHSVGLRFFEIARVLVRFDHVAGFIVNTTQVFAYDFCGGVLTDSLLLISLFVPLGRRFTSRLSGGRSIRR